MPYMFSEDGLCVHKKNPDGSKGKQVGCSKTHKEAVAHMAALHVAAGKEGKAIKGLMLSGMSAEDYCRQEGWDIAQATHALEIIASIVGDEVGEPDDLALLSEIMQGITRFINAEITELNAAASAPPAESESDVTDQYIAGQQEVTAGQPGFAGTMSLTDEMLVAQGGDVKALPDGQIQGYLVRFTTPKDPDLTGDYFDAKTSLHFPAELELIYNHGKDKSMKDRVLATVKTKVDEVGLWVEGQLKQRDEYEKAVAAMAKAGKLGFSSGALSHLVNREPAGKAWHIKSWWIGEASLTPRPAEFRNEVIPLKSWNSSDQAALTDADVKSKSQQERKTMDENEIKAASEKAVAEALAKRDAEQKAEAEKQAALKAAEEDGYKKAVKDLKDRKAPAFNIIETSNDPEKRNGGVDGFNHWIKTGQENSELIRPESRYQFAPWEGDPYAMKAAFNVTTGGSGGFLVPDILYGTIQAKRDVQSWVRQAPVQHFQTPADHLLVPVENTKHTAFTLTAESGTYTENEGTVSQKDLIIYKYTKEVRMSEEFIAYNQTNFDAWLASALARAAGVTENTAFTLGAGGSAPEGIVTGGTDSGKTPAALNALTAAELISVTGVLGAGYNVQGECGFLMPNATRAYISGLAGNFFSFAPTPISSGAPTNVYGANFFGYPVYISDDVAAMSVALGKELVFANFNYYGVVERPGMMIQRNPYLHMDIGQVSLFASIWRGGGVLQAEAVYYLTNHS